MSAQPVGISIPPAIQLERILYATDFSRASERALPIVSAIARHYGSQVHIAHVWTSKPYPIPQVGRPITSEEETQARGHMANLLVRPELQNLRTTELEERDPIERIPNYVQAHAINLVILGTHGRTRLEHALMGSVAEELFPTLKCPVLTIGPNLDARITIAKTINRILFPTDLSPESKAVFPHLASLAAEFGSQIVILACAAKRNRDKPGCEKARRTLAT